LDSIESLSPEELQAAPETRSAGLLSQTDAEDRLGLGDQTADANWEIVDNHNQTSVFKFIANTAAYAQIRYEQWLAVAGLPTGTRDYGLRRLASVETEPQNFPAAGNTFTGEWKVVDGLNREVYRFGGVGNSQSDANRVAREWAQRTGFDGTLEVYPVMSSAAARPPASNDGHWEIRDSSTNQVLHTFSGIGTRWEDANQVAAQWLQQNGSGNSGTLLVHVTG
jgi:hypothetical protein